MPSKAQDIVVRGAREHNLKGVDLAIPRLSLTTFTGVSGSGKSSLAYHTLFREGQRRFLESLSSYARQFLGRMEKPRVDHVEGLSPTVSIDQKSAGLGARSTVGTITEVMDFLRLLFARLGDPTCPECGAAIENWTAERIARELVESHAGERAMLMAPVIRERKGEYRKELAEWRGQGFVRARIDGEVRRLDEDIQLHRYKYHTIELVMDRLRLPKKVDARLVDAVEQSLGRSGGLVTLLLPEASEGKDYRLFSTERACPNGHGSLPELEPRTFSFNSPMGACATCDGLGETHSFSEELVVAHGDRSIADGALHAFKDDGGLIYSRLTLDHLGLVADHYGADLDKPWNKQPKRFKEVVLYGSGKQRFEFAWKRKGQNMSGSGKERIPWPGVMVHLEAAYRPSRARHLDRFLAGSPCPECHGDRLGPVGRTVRFHGHTLPEVLRMTVWEAKEWADSIALVGNQAKIGHDIRIEIQRRLDFLGEVGLGYLSLERRARTLSGGEAQRIRLAAQVGAGLRGILYILDEPSIGLHHRDQERLLGTLAALRDRGNTVVVVEHDEDTMWASDHLVDIGPGAGRHGGEVVASGTPAHVAAEGDSPTGRFLRGEAQMPVPDERRAPGKKWLTVEGASHHNLKSISARFPLGLFTAVTGVSGSGKSTLVNHVLKKALRRTLHGSQDIPGKHKRIRGLQHLQKLVEIDQAPIGRTPRSNPATYTGVWTHIRDLYAALPESRLREYKKGRFSFNVAGGRCESCEGAGVSTLEMNFLAPVEVECEDCGGRRFNPETLEIAFKGHSVADVLDMTIEDALELFQDLTKIKRGLQALVDVGLGYVKLGQPSTTLSGGEAQRIKLASELQRPAIDGQTLYLLDEPTTGLHFEDIRRLLGSLQRLVDAGNTVVVIEHNLDVIRCADWLLELGPDGGAGGGEIVAEGTPENIAAHPESPTGVALAPLLNKKRRKAKALRTLQRRENPLKKAEPLREIRVEGARMHNLQNISARIPLDSFTVITGVSGSGKTSLAFDTLFAEGQRRFVESMSTYARRFLGRLDRAPVDTLEGIGPAIAIDQKAASRSPRSTVATTTEIHDYLRLLYARVGRPQCPNHGQELVLHTPNSIAKTALEELDGEKGYVLAPVHIPSNLAKKPSQLAGWLKGHWEDWQTKGFVRALWNGGEHRLDGDLPQLPAKWSADDPEPELCLIVDRVSFTAASKGRLVDAASQAADEAEGRVLLRTVPRGKDSKTRELTFSMDRACALCGHSVPHQPHPRYFSFNHHQGACNRCGGLGDVVRCDPELLVNRPEKPVFGGAIQHKGAAFTFLTKRTGYFAKVAKEVAKEYGFDLTTPWHEQPEDVQQILLWGTGERRYTIRRRSNRASGSRSWSMDVKWKGLAAQVEDWFHGQGQGQDSDPGAHEQRYGAVMRRRECPACQGERLGLAQRYVLVGGRNLPEFTALTVAAAREALRALRLRKNERVIAAEILKEIAGRLHFLDDVGLGYLTLDRSSATLSGGEAQRIRLATQLGNRLVGVLYVLDEPTVGLHARDTARLLKTLHGLRELGNTVVAVEHDEMMIRAADHVLDMGPGAGRNGGLVVASGTPEVVARGDSLTGRSLRGELMAPWPEIRRSAQGHVTVQDLKVHNLKSVTLKLPMGCLTAVTGVSGSGKSSLIMDGMVPAIRSENADVRPKGTRRSVPCDLFVVDQEPIGTTPSSNPATYLGVFTAIRELFASLPESRTRGYKPGRFSFNVADGRCADCEGKGQLRVEMHFLADVWVTCETCGGKRYNPTTLEVRWQGRSIADVLLMEVADAAVLFANHRKVAGPLQLLTDVGLGYLQLGQSATTLSGGEAQRLKLVEQLARNPRRHAIHVLDEPTTGLHMEDVRKLLVVLQRLVDRGDTVVVIEHHLDVIAAADHVLEMGPEAGDQGGEILIADTPEAVAASGVGHTAPFLQQLLTERRGSAAAAAELEGGA